MISPTQFLERIGIDNQDIQKKHPAGSDWDLLKILQRFQEMNNIGDLLHEFWQRNSYACPLEASMAEDEETNFKEWVRQQQL